MVLIHSIQVRRGEVVLFEPCPVSYVITCTDYHFDHLRQGGGGGVCLLCGVSEGVLSEVFSLCGGVGIVSRGRR